jgi:hypothetical protein
VWWTKHQFLLADCICFLLMFCSEFHPFGMPPVIFWVLFSGHLPLDFLVRFLLVSFTLFLQNFMSSLLNSLSLSQPLSCMQVLEDLTWKHVWKHFVQFGAITVSCSLSLWHVSKSALVYIFEVGDFIFFACTSKSSPLYYFISMIIVMNSPSGYLGFYCAIIAATIKIVLLLVWGHYYHCCL